MVEENLVVRATSARHPADLLQWIPRHSARSRRKADARRTRKEPRTNLRVRRRASPEEKAAKHLAEDEGRAEQVRATADGPAGTEANGGTVFPVPPSFFPARSFGP